MAARSKFTPATVDRLVQNVRLGLPYKLAAEAAGVSYSTLKDWQAGRFPRGADRELKASFPAALTRAQAEGALKLTAQIHAAVPDDWRAAAWLLERRYPDAYGKRPPAGPTPGAIEITIIRAVLVSALRDYPDARGVVAEALLQLGAGDGHAQ